MSSLKKFSKNPNLLFIIFSVVLPLISSLTIMFIFKSRRWRIGLLIVIYYLIIMTSLVIVISFFFGYIFFDKKNFLYYFPIFFLIFFRILPDLIIVLLYNYPINRIINPFAFFFLVNIVIVSECIGYYLSRNRDKKALQNQNHLKPYSTHKYLLLFWV